MNTQTGTALEVVDPHGEIVDIGTAETERVAQVLADIDDARARFADVAEIVSDELIRRLDRRAEWTLRVGDHTGDQQFEIKTASPTAGTEAYDAVLLETELRALVDRNTIDEEGAALALERTLTIRVNVPLDADLDRMERNVKASSGIQIDGVDVAVDNVAAGRKARLGGIAKLRKVTGTGAALDRAKIASSPPKRRASVKVLKREPA